MPRRHFLLMGGYAPLLLNYRGHLLKALLDAGYEVTACAPSAESPPDMHARLAAHGVRYITVPIERAGMNPFSDLRGLLALRNMLRRERPDVFLAYGIKPVIYGSLAARSVGVPRRCALIPGLGYSFGNQSLKGRLVGAVSRQLYRSSLSGVHVLFLQNPDDRELLLREGLATRSQIVLVNGSGVDVDHYQVAPLPEAPPKFLLAGRLITDKGIREYVAAARRLKRQYEDVEFHLLAPPEQTPNAIPVETVRSWEQEGIIEYHGQTDDVRPIFSRCSVFVLPSYYREGTPRTSLEAMSMGRPIITTDEPGCRETVVEGRNGFLVESRDADSLSAAMSRFIENPHIISCMGRESRRIVEERYDVHRVNAVMLEAIERHGLGPTSPR